MVKWNKFIEFLKANKNLLLSLKLFFLIVINIWLLIWLFILIINNSFIINIFYNDSTLVMLLIILLLVAFNLFFIWLNKLLAVFSLSVLARYSYKAYVLYLLSPYSFNYFGFKAKQIIAEASQEVAEKAPGIADAGASASYYYWVSVGVASVLVIGAIVVVFWLYSDSCNSVDKLTKENEKLADAFNNLNFKFLSLEKKFNRLSNKVSDLRGDISDIKSKIDSADNNPENAESSVSAVFYDSDSESLGGFELLNKKPKEEIINNGESWIKEGLDNSAGNNIGGNIGLVVGASGPILVVIIVLYDLSKFTYNFIIKRAVRNARAISAEAKEDLNEGNKIVKADSAKEESILDDAGE